MPDEKYYTITQSGDGDISIKELTSAELEKEMKDWIKDDCAPAFIKSLKGHNDPMYWLEHSILIIKGRLVFPKTKKVVTKLEID